MTPFADIIQTVQPLEDSTFRVNLPEDWLQGRTAFGGLSSAVIVEAMSRLVPADRPLRTMAVSFVGPALAGEQCIHLRMLRQGGSVSHIQGELLCDGLVATSINAAFGKAINNPADIAADSRPPDLRAPADCEAMPYVEGFTPAFTRHFEMRFERGAMPMSGADTADYGVWLRFREPTPIDTPALVAIGDMPPLPGLNMGKPPCVGSSLSWYLEFPISLENIDPAGWWYYDYRAQAASSGYFNNNGSVWAPDGRAAMFTRQVAMVFQK